MHSFFTNNLPFIKLYLCEFLLIGDLMTYSYAWLWLPYGDDPINGSHIKQYIGFLRMCEKQYSLVVICMDLSQNVEFIHCVHISWLWVQDKVTVEFMFEISSFSKAYCGILYMFLL